MSLNFTGGETGSPLQEYQQRKRYNEYLNNLGDGFLFLDTLYKKKHYGFLNKRFEVIQPIMGIDPVLFGTYAGEVYGLNYVVDQFNEFRKYYLEVASTTDLKVPELISELNPENSYRNFEDGYSINISALVQVFRVKLQRLIAEDNSSGLMSPKNFFQKVNESILFSEDLSGRNISKSGYAISEHSSVYETGLYIDLSSTYPGHLDRVKGEMIEDPGFQCYVEFANMFGFFVDMNVPWRLALNLSSLPTKVNILNGRDRQSYWDFYYDQYCESTGHIHDFFNIKIFYENLYKAYYKLYNGYDDSQMREISWRDEYTRLAISSFSERPPGARGYIDPYAEYNNFFVEIMLINRLREVGVVSSFQEYLEIPKWQNMKRRALSLTAPRRVSRINPNQLQRLDRVGNLDTSAHGFITTSAAALLKEQIFSSLR